MKFHEVSLTALVLRLAARTRDADMPFLCKPSLGFGTIVTVTVSTQHFSLLPLPSYEWMLAFLGEASHYLSFSAPLQTFS